MRIYNDVMYCPICDQDTMQHIVDAQHERDGSGDSRECLVCGASYSGFTGKWTQRQTPTEEEE